MSVLTDVETSAEALQEDEELIEAVEQFVETAAVTIYKDLRNDVEDIVSKIKALVESVFPFIVKWQQDRSAFWDDMQKVALVVILYAICFILLSPSKRRNKKMESWLSFSYRAKRVSSFNVVSEMIDGNSGTHRRTLSDGDDKRVDRCTVLAAGRYMEEDATDEENFAKLWPTIIEQSRYGRLVLPPTCKRVEKPKDRKKEKEQKSEKRRKHKDDSDEDHPANRLRNYFRQFMLLIVSFLKYDYVGAGWYLIHWIQACLRLRQSRESDDEDNEDDESDTGSVQSHIQRNSVASASAAKRASRSKRDTLQQSAEAGDDENDSVGSTIKTSLTVDTIHSFPDSSADEEKKDNPSTEDGRELINRRGLATPPLTPKSPATPRGEEDLSFSEFQTPPHEYSSHPPRLVSNGLAERVASRLTVPGKPKDALDNYRAGSILKSHLAPRPHREHDPIDLTQKHSESNNSVSEGSAYYFEAANSNASLRKMAVDVPVPDKNGYILGDDFLADNASTPLLVFVNSRSGPQQGHLLITQLRRLLNPIQVWDLADGGPEEILESFASSLTRLRILVCGGDGTVSWIVSTIEKMKLKRWPPIAILPLGTGNDLARIHGWGGGYNNESLIRILEQVAESYISWLDRWELVVENKKGKVKSVKSFFNYLGVGADAQAALQVHMLRESRPQLFFSRVINKAWYGIFGAEDIIKATSVNLPYEITLIADGVEVPLPEDSQGIILLNIDSYAGGCPLWSDGTKAPPRRNSGQDHRPHLKRSRSLGSLVKSPARSLDRVDSVEDLRLSDLSDEEKYARVTACDRPSSCQDGFLDIVSIRGAFHLGQIRVGLSNAQRLCQCREATIIIKRKVSVQIDGEPWRQNVCTLRVRRKKDAAIMLHKSAEESHGVETEVANLLDWAEERELIDPKVHAQLMKEFSRRIEYKTRQRRTRSNQDNLMLSLRRAIASSGNFQQQSRDRPLMF